MSYTLQELLARDTVQVELIPEKKGLFLKHVEYEVSSQVRSKWCVRVGERRQGGGGTGTCWGGSGVCQQRATERVCGLALKVRPKTRR